MKAMVDVVAIASQATGFVVWPILEGSHRPNLWLIPATLFCLSCGWWENYVSKHSVFGKRYISQNCERRVINHGLKLLSNSKNIIITFPFSFTVFMRPLWKVKERLKRTRYFTYIFMSVWKISGFLIFTLLIRMYRGESVNHFFTLLSKGFSQHKIRITEVFFFLLILH